MCQGLGDAIPRISCTIISVICILKLLFFVLYIHLGIKYIRNLFNLLIVRSLLLAYICAYDSGESISVRGYTMVSSFFAALHISGAKYVGDDSGIIIILHLYFLMIVRCNCIILSALKVLHQPR